VKGVQWRDEFGRPLSGEKVDLAAAPVVGVALVMAEDKLFDASAVSQRGGASGPGRPVSSMTELSQCPYTTASCP
jgi:hypothetical protein